MNEWNIQSRSHACQACEKPFSDKQPYFTLLFDEGKELKRLDICEPCGKARTEDPEPQKTLISRWHGVYLAPPPAPPEAIQKETAETLLRKLIEANDPAHAAACYILAVMLERKRLLKVKEQFKREDGVRMFIYEHPPTGDIFPIADPDLRLDQLEQVQRDVGQLLEHGLNPPAAPAVTTETAAVPAETTPEQTNQTPPVDSAEPAVN
jgi:hypothetical protein